MEQSGLLIIDLGKFDTDDVKSFCKLNDITDIDGFANLCFRKGYYIEKYGLLNQGQLPEVIDREFEKQVMIEDNSKIDELQNEIYILKGKLENQKEFECGKLQQSLMELNRQIGDKNKEIETLNKKIEELENLTKTSYAFYLKNSNLKQIL
jgi:proteasome assembly chaperone (PAC2) family protein